MPQGVSHTVGGILIYEDEEEAFFEERADYYYDASARDSSAARMKWVTRFRPRGDQLLDLRARFRRLPAWPGAPTGATR